LLTQPTVRFHQAVEYLKETIQHSISHWNRGDLIISQVQYQEEEPVEEIEQNQSENEPPGGPFWEEKRETATRIVKEEPKGRLPCGPIWIQFE